MDRDANDITQMMPTQNVVGTKGSKSPKLIWIVLACVVVGVVGGIVVYQQSIKTKTAVKTTPRPVASKAPTVATKPSPSAKLMSPVASASAQPAGVNLVDDWQNNEYEEDDPDLPGSPSPSASSSLIASASTSPSSSVKASASVKASSTTSTKTATASATTRVTMPDTAEGVPVTGIFEITAGTIGAGVLLIILGALGLLLL